MPFSVLVMFFKVIYEAIRVFRGKNHAVKLYLSCSMAEVSSLCITSCLAQAGEQAALVIHFSPITSMAPFPTSNITMSLGLRSPAHRWQRSRNTSDGVQSVDINITGLCQTAPRFLSRQRSWFATVASVFMCNARHEPWPGALTKRCDRSTSRMASSRC
jgi:hypothetical protein